jgi:phage repressor protein C with HTH and peptisase S24 domain
LSRSERYSLLEVELPGQGILPAGVLLEDPSTNHLYVRLRRDWDKIAGEDDAEMLAALSADLNLKAGELGADALLTYLENTLSNTVRIGERSAVMVEDFDRALDRLYRKHVPATPHKFVTHLPCYSIQVAAGKFLENQEVEARDWVEAPEDLRLTDDMFIAQIFGHSMEPRIPGGSLCIFRHGVTGSREGRLVLVEWLGGGVNDRYTVKRYHSEKRQTEEGWRHERILLEPLNPDFEAWYLDPDEEKYRIIAEFVRVLE